MLAPAHRDLKLRQHIPIRSRAIHQIARGYCLNDGRPHPAERMVIAEAFAQGCPQEHRLRRFVRIHRQIGAALHLQKTVGRQRLPERREGSERSRARAEAARAVPRRQRHFALHSQNAPRVHIRKQHALPAKRDLSHAAQPPRTRMVEAERDRHFELILLAVALFERELIGNARRALHVDAGRDHCLVFREGFLRQQSAREIHLTAWPSFLLAKAAQGLNNPCPSVPTSTHRETTA